MPRKITCPGCKSVLIIPDHTQGKAIRVQCKKCGKKLAVGPNKSAPAQQAQAGNVIQNLPPQARKKKKGAPVLLLVLGFICLLCCGGVSAAGVGVWYFTSRASNALQAGIKKFETKMKGTEFPEPKEKINEPKEKQPNGNTGKTKKDKSKKTDPKKNQPKENQPPVRTEDGALTLAVHPQLHLLFMAVSPDGKALYTAAHDNVLRIWDMDRLALKSETPLPKPDKQRFSRLHAALTADGKSLVFAHWDILQIMDLATKKAEVFQGVPNEKRNLGSIHLSGDGKTAVTGWNIVTNAVWNVAERKFISKLKYKNMGRTGGATLAQDGSFWIHAPSDSFNGARQLSLPDSRILGVYSGPEKPTGIQLSVYHTRAPTISPTAGLLAYALTKSQDDRRIRTFDVGMRNMIKDMPLLVFSKGFPKPLVSDIAISPDERLLVAIDNHRWVHGYDLVAGKLLGAFPLPRPKSIGTGGNDKQAVAFTRDGRRLLVGACNFVKIFERDALDWEKLQHLAANNPKKTPTKPKTPKKTKDPNVTEYQNAVLKNRLAADYVFEVNGKTIRAKSSQDTNWIDTSGKKTRRVTLPHRLLQNPGNTVHIKVRPESGSPNPVLVEVRAVKLVSEIAVFAGSTELKGARVTKVSTRRHAWLKTKDGKEYHTILTYFSLVKDQSGKRLDGRTDIFKNVLRVDGVVDVILAPRESGRTFHNLVFAQPATTTQ